MAFDCTDDDNRMMAILTKLREKYPIPLEDIEFARNRPNPEHRQGYYEAVNWDDDNAKLDAAPKIRYIYYAKWSWEDEAAIKDIDLSIRAAYFTNNPKDERAKEAPEFSIQMQYFANNPLDPVAAVHSNEFIRLQYHQASSWKDYSWYNDESIMIIRMGFLNCTDFTITESFYQALEKLFTTQFCTSTVNLKIVLRRLDAIVLAALAFRKIIDPNVKNIIQQVLKEKQNVAEISRSTDSLHTDDSDSPEEGY